MEKEYVFMKLSAAWCHMLKAVNVDCRGNTKSVDPNIWLAGSTGCMFVYCSFLYAKL